GPNPAADPAAACWVETGVASACRGGRTAAGPARRRRHGAAPVAHCPVLADGPGDQAARRLVGPADRPATAAPVVGTAVSRPPAGPWRWAAPAVWSNRRPGPGPGVPR